MSSNDIREQVRERYAAAAVRVMEATAKNDDLVLEDCCTGDAQCSCACGESEGAPSGDARSRNVTTETQQVTAQPAVAGQDSEGSCCSDSADTCCGDSAATGSLGGVLYSALEQRELPAAAVEASLGCGNPTAVADLHPGERVLDLGSGGGIDVLLSARRVGPTGYAYGVDMTDEMLALARSNARQAGASNVEFLKGTIEDVPLPDASIDVVISNCVVNLSTDKPAVLREMYRVLASGGRIGITDVVAEDDLTPADRAARGSYVGCIAGALSRSEYVEGLSEAGFVDVEVEFTSEAAPGLHSSIVRAAKPQERS